MQILRIVSNISKKYILVSLILILVCFSLAISYSTFTFSTGDYEVTQMMINSLSYTMNINGTATNNYIVSPGTSTIIVELNSLDTVNTYYKLAYETNSNLIVYSRGDEPSGLSSPLGTKTLTLSIINKSSSNITINIKLFLGYNINGLDNVIVSDGYTQITVLGDVLSYLNFKSTTASPTTESYYITDFNCTGGASVSYDSLNKKLDITNYSGTNICVSTAKSKPLLSQIAKIGDYVLYEGNNGCTSTSNTSLDTVFNSQCKGMNANYSSSSSMGYCQNSLYKYYTNGWRIAYYLDSNSDNILEPYIVNAGSSSCINSIENDSSSTITNLNTEAIKYCNANYAYGGGCQTTYNIAGNNYNTWALKGTDYYQMTLQLFNNGKRLCGYDTETENSTGDICYNEYSIKSCGYNNDLFDNGGLYWFGSAYSSNGILMWGSYGRYITSTATVLTYGQRSIVHLKQSIYVTGGSGTQNDPYIIGY